jgi:hypothetical protein
MKKLVTAAIVMMVAAISHADLNFALTPNWGINAVGGGALLSGDETGLVQIFNAGANGSVDSVTSPGGGTFGDDTLLSSLTLDTDVDQNHAYGYFTLNASQAGSNGNSVFIRVYQDSTASLNSYYYESGIITAADNGTLNPPLTLYFGSAEPGDDVNLQVIPEPATIGLLGIAAAGLFAARRKVRV